MGEEERVREKNTKKLFAVILLLTMLIPSALAEEAAPHVLVVYLSCAGENYNVGVAREGYASAAYAGYIEKGNTAMMAAVIADMTGGDLFEITTVTPYPEDYASMLRVAQEEIDTDARPELAAHVENMADYDVVFVGYPIWWYDAPMIVLTFLESYDFSGKTVIPFATSGGSPLSDSLDSVRASAAGATIGDGILANDAGDVAPWISGLGYAK